MQDEKTESALKIIEHQKDIICNDFCKYRETVDDEAECEWIRGGNVCPLDRI